jgi:hypothetical protein
MAVRQDVIAQSMWDDYQQRILGRLDVDIGTDDDYNNNGEIPVYDA